MQAKTIGVFFVPLKLLVYPLLFYLYVAPDQFCFINTLQNYPIEAILYHSGNEIRVTGSNTSNKTETFGNKNHDSVVIFHLSKAYYYTKMYYMYYYRVSNNIALLA